MRSCIVLLSLLVAGCRGGNSTTIPPGPKSPAGWAVRYNAVLALANRGSDKFIDPEIWDTLVEMLDEPQQLRNFTARLENGSEVPDPSAARLAVIGALKAVQSFHQKKPQTDLGRLTDAIARVVQSENAPVRVEAEKTKLALFGK